MNSYSVSMDKLARIITGSLFVIMIILAALMLLPIEKTASRAVLTPLILMLAFIILGCFLFHPMRYELTGNALLVVRYIKPLSISYDEVEQIGQPSAKDMKRTIRTFGNGGLFGYFGKFYNSKFGGMTWYATRRGNYVMLVMKNGKKVVLTPDDPSGMAKELEVYVA